MIRAWQLGDIGQGARELAPDRSSVFAPPSRISPLIIAAATSAKSEGAVEVPHVELARRSYICGTCEQTFQAGKRGKVPTKCPDHREGHGRRPGRARVPKMRVKPALAAALVSFVEGGGLVWKTRLGDYLAKRIDGPECHASSIEAAIAATTVTYPPAQ